MADRRGAGCGELRGGHTPLKIRQPGEWERIGRGHELQFYATDEEVARFLDLAVVEDGITHTVLATKSVQQQGAYRVVALRVPNVFEGLKSGLSQFWIAPEAVVNVVNEIASPTGAEGALALTGFVMVQHGLQHRGKRVASRIAVTPRVRKIATGEEVLSKTSLTQFRRLERGIRKDLRYATLKMFPDGQRLVDEERVLMTAGACALASSGFFDRDCGPAIKV